MPRFAELDSEGVRFIAKEEGNIPYVYDDLVYPTTRWKPGVKVIGTLTAGVGHTDPDDIKAWVGKDIPSAVRDKWLDKDLDVAERAVNDLVTVRITENQRTALVSLAFNVGVSNFKKSTLLKKLNKGDFKGAAAEFPKWNKSKGKVLGGLVKRRAAEAALFTSGMVVDTPSNAAATKDAPNWVTPETVGVAVSGASGVATVATGSGPFQYALAIVFVLAAITAIGFFVWKRVAAK